MFKFDSYRTVGVSHVGCRRAPRLEVHSSQEFANQLLQYHLEDLYIFTTHPHPRQMTDQQLPVSPEVAEAVSTTPALTSASTSAGPTTFATPTPTLSDEFAEQWYHNANSTARAAAEGVEDPFKAYEMPQIPAGYVVGTAAVLGGGQGEFGNEGEGRDSSNDKYLYEVRPF